jgi:Cd2+/Zn2+-exporting ATPase
MLVLVSSGLALAGSLVVRWAVPESLPVSALAEPVMLAAAAIAGGQVAARALSALRARHVSIELLVTVAAIGAVAIGEYWEAAAVTFLFVVGSALEAAAMAKTRRVIGDLLELAPARATVVRGGERVEVDAAEVQRDEAVLVLPGEKLPVDGEVRTGRSTVDEQSITGESVPRDIGPGDRVYAGTINQMHALWLTATGVGSDTTLARIIERVEEAQEARAPVQRFMDRFARWYTPGIILLSGAVLLATANLELALTILVIACPGALVISTPVSVVSGIGRAARSGILMKGGEYLERAGTIDTVVFDKTGTLTTGTPELAETVVLETPPRPLVQPVESAVVASGSSAAEAKASPGVSVSDEEALLWWASLAEAGSAHPLAEALLRRAETANELPAIPQDAESESFAGLGVTARYAGHTVTVGSLRMLDHEPPEAERLEAAGMTVAAVQIDGTVHGLLGFSDTIRGDAAAAVAELARSGVRTVIASGDTQQTADAVARAVGIDEAYGALLPEDKLSLLERLQRRGATVAMVGDGVNDTPALTTAEIGIAMGAAGSDIAIESADIALLTDDLRKVAEATLLSRATLRNIRQNVAIALLTVAALLAGVLFGAVHMASGMLVHELSVLVVTLNGMRLLARRGTAA